MTGNLRVEYLYELDRPGDSDYCQEYQDDDGRSRSHLSSMRSEGRPRVDPLVKLAKPRRERRGSVYMRRGSFPWGGLGGYPITPRTNVPLGMKERPPSCACTTFIDHTA